MIDERLSPVRLNQDCRQDRPINDKYCSSNVYFSISFYYSLSFLYSIFYVCIVPV